jgi:polyhydroxybutyrate depolymerase
VPDPDGVRSAGTHVVGASALVVALLAAALVGAVLAPVPGGVAAAGTSPDTSVGVRSTTTRPASAARHREVRPSSNRPRLRASSILVDGVRRQYLESVPAGLRAPAPLVIAFHGLFQTASSFARQTGLLAATAAAHEVLVLPQSQGPAFNDGRLGPRCPHDDAFAIALIDRLERTGIVDSERVTVAGFSNGAGMAMQIADAHPDRVAAVVSIDGEMIRASYAPRPTGPVEAVLVHGTADRIQPWLGRRGWGYDFPAYVSVMATVDAWVRADGAGRRQVTYPGAPSGLGPHASAGRAAVARLRASRVVPPGVVAPVTATRWAPGRTGAGVTFYRITGMGHRWPVTSAAADYDGDQLAAVSATAIIVRTASTASREGRTTVMT